ncbi:TPM domain-containing protein [Oxalobacteraceae bacterium]|nr:TPM domain-containing protein [Oxalobacteraceae bacterium]
MSALRRCLLLVLVLLAGTWAGAQTGLQALPALTSPVTDLTGTLSGAQRSQLEASLHAFEQRKGSQIALLILPTTQPEAIEQFAIRLAEQWKIGRGKVDDGAILVVAKDDRTLRIEVGYGLEGALNDATSKRIIEEKIVPLFKQNDYFGGVKAGLEAMQQVIEGEALPPPAQRGAQEESDGMSEMLPVGMIAALVLGGVLRSLLGRGLGAAVTGGVIGAGAWLMAGAIWVGVVAGVLGFFFTLIGAGKMAGLYLGSGHGSGGGGGGGWGGGGGGFGGGGASGRW